MLSYHHAPSSFQLFLSLFLLVIQLAKEIVLEQIGRIKAPDPWKGHTSTMSSGVHIHRSQYDVEGVAPYYGMGANWMFDGSWGI